MKPSFVETGVVRVEIDVHPGDQLVGAKLEDAAEAATGRCATLPEPSGFIRSGCRAFSHYYMITTREEA